MRISSAQHKNSCGGGRGGGVVWCDKLHTRMNYVFTVLCNITIKIIGPVGKIYCRRNTFFDNK